MRSPRLRGEPALVARGSFEGALVESKQLGCARAYRVEVGRGKGRLMLGAEKAGKWTAPVSNQAAWTRAPKFEESLLGKLNLSNPFSQLRPLTVA